MKYKIEISTDNEKEAMEIIAVIDKYRDKEINSEEKVK